MKIELKSRDKYATSLSYFFIKTLFHYFMEYAI